MKLYAFPQASLEKAIAKRMLGLGAPHREWFAERWSQKPYKKSFIELTDAPAFSFQGHPEASPGPHDVAPLFDKFIALMEAR